MCSVDILDKSTSNQCHEVMELYDDDPRKKPQNEDVHDNNGIDEEEFTEIDVAENQPR